MPILDQSKLPKKISDKYVLQNNALVQAVKTDWKDTISAEVGDTKDATTFQPQVKITRWDNEVNFSLRLINDEENPTIEFEGEKTKWKGEKVEAHFYDKPEASEDGGHEMEIVLKEKPKINILEFSIETKGLEFFLQPELTDDEVQKLADRKGITLLKAKRLMRPENVVDSYAVYYKDCPANLIFPVNKNLYTIDELEQMISDGTHTKKIDKNGEMQYFSFGKKYFSGKAFHIYRIKATDAKGVSVWGKQNIDVAKKLHTIELPQEFLDEAAYPVVVDPTFGYTTAGGSSTDIGYNEIDTCGDTFTGVAGTGTSMSFYGKREGDDSDVQMAVYTNASPSAKVTNGSTGSVSINDSVAKWWNSNFASSPTFSAAQYYLVSNSNASDYLTYIAYDSAATNSVKYKAQTFGTWPSTITWSNTTVNYKKFSIYVTYTEAASGIEVSPSAVNVTFATVAPTVSAVRNIESTPAVQAVTAALLAVAVGIGALFGATQVNATMATIAPTVSAVRAVNIAPAVQNSNFALPASTTVAIRSVDATPSAQNANFALVAPVITAVQAIAINPSVLNGTFATQAATVSGIQAINTVPSVQNATLALVSASVSAIRVVDISVSTQNATIVTVSPAISAIQNITIAPNTQNGTIALQAASITSVGTVEVVPAAQNITFALPSATVSCVIAVQINSTVINATFAAVSPAITYGNNIAVLCDNANFALPSVSVSYGLNTSPTTVNATFALLASAVSTVQAVNVAPTVSNAVFSIQPPTILGAGAINVDPDALNAALITVAPTITTIRFVESTPGVQNGTFAIPAAVVGAGLSVNPETQNALLSLLAVSITTGVNVNPETQNVILATQSVEIVANRSVNLEPSVLNITFADIDPVISGGMIDVSAGAQNAVFSTPAVSVLTIQNITISPDALIGVLAMPVTSVSAAIGAYVSAGLQNAVFVTLTHGVDLNSITLSMDVLTADFYILRVPTIYTDKYSAKGTIYTDKYSAKGTIYTDKYSKI